MYASAKRLRYCARLRLVNLRLLLRVEENLTVILTENFTVKMYFAKIVSRKFDSHYLAIGRRKRNKKFELYIRVKKKTKGKKEMSTI